MERFRNYVWMAAGFVILAAAISALTPGSALAQIVKAALVKNVDEPGRNFLTLEFFQTYAPNYIVPVGKILVIEQVMSSGSPAGSIQCLGFNGTVVQGTNGSRWTTCFTPNSSGIVLERVRLYAKGGQTVDYTRSGNPPQLHAQGYLIDAN